MQPDQDSLIKLEIEVDLGSELDKDQIDTATRNLLSELRDVEVESAKLLPGEQAPEHTKSAEAVTIGSLAVAVLPTFLPKLVEFLQSWAMRAENRTVKIKSTIGDRSIELEYSPNAMSQAELEDLINTITDSLST